MFHGGSMRARLRKAEIALECGRLPLVVDGIMRLDSVVGVQVVAVLCFHYFSGLAGAAISLQEHCHL
jgi:hypothetical protein